MVLCNATIYTDHASGYRNNMSWLLNQNLNLNTQSTEVKTGLFVKGLKSRTLLDLTIHTFLMVLM